MIRVGSRVRVCRDEDRYPPKGTWLQYRNKVGTVVATNLGEYGVVFGQVRHRYDGSLQGGNPVWFRSYELSLMNSGGRHRLVAQTDENSSPVRPPSPAPFLAPGTSYCHCRACGHTFTGITAFDTHRLGGKCNDPATLLDKHGRPRLVLVEKKHWIGWRLPGEWEGPEG